jgi:UDP-3-O-[3-hydroxymyristoyl] glucosamine N-acyltransferase
MIGGQVGIAGHLTRNNVRIQAQSGVGRNVKDDEVYKEVQHLDTMIIVNHTYTLKTYQNRCRIRRIKKQILNQKKGNNG